MQGPGTRPRRVMPVTVRGPVPVTVGMTPAWVVLMTGTGLPIAHGSKDAPQNRLQHLGNSARCAVATWPQPGRSPGGPAWQSSRGDHQRAGERNPAPMQINPAAAATAAGPPSATWR